MLAMAGISKTLTSPLTSSQHALGTTTQLVVVTLIQQPPASPPLAPLLFFQVGLAISILLPLLLPPRLVRADVLPV